MIRMIRGVVSEQYDQQLIVDVQGIGYGVFICEPNAQFTTGSTVTLHTYLAVRETALDLYGFSTTELRTVFEQLITLPKIGPKSAQHILAQADIRLLKDAVQQNDPSYLAKMSGIGKKSAEKIVIGLRDQFEYTDEAELVSNDDLTIPYAADTIDALIALGYPPESARRAVKQVSAHDDVTDTKSALTAALRTLSS